MRPIRVLFLSGVALSACGAPSPTSPNQESINAGNVLYLNVVVDTLQQYSYYRAAIDWGAVRQQAVTSVQNGTSRTEAILAAIKVLNDNHSYYIPPNTSSPLTPFITPECAANASPRLPFEWPSDIGFVPVGAFSGTAAAASLFATNLQATIRDQDRPGNAGWVVDLRHNTGGNYSPMVSGVGPILGEGLAGYFVRSDESSTAVAFRGRPDTRTFGGHTCGRSTGIVGHRLGDGGILGIMDSIDADRLGNTYGGVMVPDERISDDLQLYARVVAWIREGR